MLFCNKSVPFNPRDDIPSLEGKVILVTGANIGLGKQAVLEFARHNPRQIWLAARNLDKARAAASEIQQQVPGAPIKILKLDLASFDSVKKAASTFMSESDRLDILMLNAGVMAAAAGLTEEGYETQFGTNHMGHALFARLLHPVLETTAKTTSVRVVSLSSVGHRLWRKGGFDFESLKTPADHMGPYPRYFRSKLANVLWARHMAKEHPWLTVVAVHPGAVQTNLGNGTTGSWAVTRMALKLISYAFTSVEDGVKNQLWAAVSNDVQSGEYYEPVGISGQTSVDGLDDGLATEVWEWTQQELDGHCA